MDHRLPNGRYRGRRRAPTPPRSRYASVVTTAFVGAGLVALTATQALPSDLKDTGYGLSEAQAAAVLDAERDEAVDAQTASRSDLRGSAQVASVDQAAADLWWLPVRTYQVSSPFGQRWGTLHGGYDMACNEGTPVYAPAPGKVIISRYNGGWGNEVSIDHGGGIVTIYGHNSQLLVKEGQMVKAGDMIARSGSTGYSTGPHVHFEIHVNGVPVDPEPFMRKRGVDLQRKIEVVHGGVL